MAEALFNRLVPDGVRAELTATGNLGRGEFAGAKRVRPELEVVDGVT
jgi:hypothetical protein